MMRFWRGHKNKNMRTSTLSKWITLAVMITIIMLNTHDAQACEACNRIFLDGLLTEGEFNSLKSKELRASIAAQSSEGKSPAQWVNDVLAMNDMTVADIDPASLSEILANHPDAASSVASGLSGSAQDLQGLQFSDVIRRDNNLSIPATSYVSQDTKADKHIRLTLEENDTYIGNGVIYKGFTVNDKIPGPTVTVEEGDIVSLTFVNEGNITHGASVHAVYSQ